MVSTRSKSAAGKRSFVPWKQVHIRRSTKSKANVAQYNYPCWTRYPISSFRKASTWRILGHLTLSLANRPCHPPAQPTRGKTRH